MTPNFPAFQLLMTLSFVLIIGLPLLIWLFMAGNRDTGARLWFAAVAVNALALIVVGLTQQFSVVAAILFVLAVLLGLYSMRWELHGNLAPWRRDAVLFTAYALFQLALDRAGLRMSVGYTVNLLVLVLGESLLTYQLWRVARLQHSRGLAMVALGIALIAVPNMFRLVQAVLAGGGPPVFTGAVVTNLALVVITLVAVLQVVGYGGFVMEKVQRRQLNLLAAKAAALERQHAAEANAEAMREVVRQRDEMILLNSRFSAVSNMALYSSAIVHEITQPLQAMTSILDTMAMRAEQQGQTPDPGVGHAMAMVQKMSATLGALRTLMGGQQPAVELLNPDAVLDDMLPIVQTQAQRQRVALQRDRRVTTAATLRANRVLLQRIVFNLVTNAFEALAEKPPVGTAARLVLDTALRRERGVDYWCLSVQDNGPGLPPGLVLRPGLALQTTKEKGVGVGLGFTQMVLESWRGELHVHNVPAEQGGGARVEVWLPLDHNKV